VFNARKKTIKAQHQEDKKPRSAIRLIFQCVNMSTGMHCCTEMNQSSLSIPTHTVQEQTYGS